MRFNIEIQSLFEFENIEMYRSLIGKVVILAIIVHVVVTQTEDGPESKPSIESGTDSSTGDGSIVDPAAEPAVNAEPAIEVSSKTNNEVAEAPEAADVAHEAIETSSAIPEASATTNEAIPAGPENSAAAVANSIEAIKASPEAIKASPAAIPDSSSEPGSEPASG